MSSGTIARRFFAAYFGVALVLKLLFCALK